MRRLLAGLTASLVIGGAAVVALAPVAPSFATAPNLTVRIVPPNGQTAVRSMDTIQFAGTVTPGSMKISAHLAFQGANGKRCKGFGSSGTEDLNVSTQLAFGADGQISGSRKLPGMGADPDKPNDIGCHGGVIWLTVVARDPNTGEETTAKSDNVGVDLVGPTIAGARLTDTDEVTVVFSEPVHLPSQPDAPIDWEVDGITPLGISGDATHKILSLPPPAKTEDATPSVLYRPGAGLLPERETYRDNTAGNFYAGGSFQIARDLIPPRIPEIDAIAGENPASAVSNDPRPQVDVSNITNGHVAELYMEANGQAGLQRPGDAFLAQDQADADGAQIIAPDFLDDGAYTLYVLARDNALCAPPDNGNGDEELCPNWSREADTGSYTLDRIAPDFIFAAVTGPTQVTVGFSEEIVGTNNPTNWTVSNAIVSAVTGSGDRRTLTVAGAQPGAQITYTPGDYRDGAENGLPAFEDLLFNLLPPVVEVTDPAGGGNVYVQADAYELKGTAENADVVEIYRNDDQNTNTPDGPAIATASVSGGSWSASVPLNANTSNRFMLRGVRTDPNIQGPLIQVAATLVQDSIPPTLTLNSLPDSAFRGEETVLISWDAGDANFQEPPGPISIEYSKDGGTTWEFLAERYTNAEGPPPCTDACFEWLTPKHNTTNALIRVTATDRSGRSASATSPAFEIDSLPPVFTASILNATQISVGFSEPVNGVLASAEWEINGEQVGSTDPAGPVTNQMTAKLTTSPLAPQIDPSQKNQVSYSPLATGEEWPSDLEDKVGNAVLTDTLVGGGGGGGGGNPPSFTVEATSPSACTVLGTDGADVLTGTDGADIICPSNGDDHIQALGGDDIILPGLGAKTIDGGDGNDEINGGPDNDKLVGGSGSDLLIGDHGTDVLNGGDQDDILLGGDGVDTLDGAGGRDVLNGGSGPDDIAGGADIDHISGGSDDDSISGGDGNDRITGEAGGDSLRGGNGNDFLDGGTQNDVLEGEAGDDELLGGDGKDQLLAGSGNDKLIGGKDNDRLSGDSGKDRLDGETGHDRLDGGDDNDKIIAGDGNDTLTGGTGNDQLTGDAGRDRLYGEDGKDRLLGGSQRDRLDGGTSRDFCGGGKGRDAKLACEGGPST